MAYTPQNWNLKTPITPDALNHMEDGISNNVDLDSNQIIDGNKTFEQPVALNGVPTENNHLIRLKDLYDKNSYYEEEHIVGNWIDGRPIFEKTVHLKSPTVTSNGNYPSSATTYYDIPSFDFCWIQEAFCKTDAVHYPIPYIQNDGTVIKVFVQGSHLTLNANATTFSNKDCYITIRYIKKD